jgi:putative ABC transport system permease protein
MFARMVMRSVTRRRSRVLIAVLAVAIGATTLFALAAVAIDIPRQMSREMRAYGANLLVLPADGAASVPADRLPAVAAAVGSDGLIGWAPYRYQTVRLNAQPYLAAGTDLAAVQAVSPYWHVDGDWPARPGQVLVGADIADWISLAPGDRVELTADDGAVMFDVAGILATGGSEDTLVLMALADLEALTGVAGHLDVVEFSVAADALTIERLAAGVEAAVPGVVATPV